ncbi:MAG: ABC transporter substrate-binding protein [Firmicutes bacterium]|nr:ABC transporter substrate-binding protein [Bacillota bacterium]
MEIISGTTFFKGDSHVKKRLLVILAIVVILSGLVYTRYIFTKDTEEIKIPVIHLVEERRTPLFIPHYVALNLGFFTEQNIDVQCSTVQEGEDALQLLSENRADVILAGPGQAILTGPPRETNNPVAFAEVTKRDGAFIMVREDKSNFQWTDVKRRTIITGPATEDTSLVLEYILRQHKISPNWEVNVIENLPPSLRPGTFMSGTGSFLVVEEPEAGRLERQGIGKVVASLGQEANSMPASTYMANPSYLDSNSQDVQKLVNGLYKAQQWIKYHTPDEIAAAVKKSFPGYDSTELVQIIKRYQQTDLWSLKPIIIKNSYENLYQAVKNSGELVNNVSYSKAVTNRYAKKAVKDIHYVPEDKQKPKPGLNWQYIKSLFN